MSRGRCHYLVLPQLPDLRTPGSREEAGVRTEEGGEQGRVRRDAEIGRPKHAQLPGTPATGDSVSAMLERFPANMYENVAKEKHLLVVLICNDKQY